MPATIPTGAVLRARYRIAQRLHQSRYADVYLVEDLHLRDRTWGVRVMPLYSVDSFARTRIIQEFSSEAQALSRLDHPNLAKVVDFFVEGNVLYIVREYVHGIDLERVLSERVGPFSEREALGAISQILDAIIYLVGRKVPAIFFRELTALNIILCKNGVVKLLDLGLARAFQPAQSEATMRVGSLDYASPEQFSEDAAFDQRSLVYSVGAILYHMLTRHNPALSPFALEPVEEINPSVSLVVEEIVHRATENDPRNRYATLSELRRTVQGAIKTPGPPRGRVRHRATPTPRLRVVEREGWRDADWSTRARVNDEDEQFFSDTSIWPWILVAVLVSVMSGALLAIYYYFFRS